MHGASADQGPLARAACGPGVCGGGLQVLQLPQPAGMGFRLEPASVLVRGHMVVQVGACCGWRWLLMHVLMHVLWTALAADA